MTRRRNARVEVSSITSAPVAHSDDLGRRMSRYLVTMGVRTACIAVAILTEGAVRWVAIVGAVVLPYIAVIAANATAPPPPGPQAPTGAFRPGPGPGPGPGLGGAATSALPPGVAERVWPSRFGPSADGERPAGPAPAGALDVTPRSQPPPPPPNA